MAALKYEGGQFALDGVRPGISFDGTGAEIGCHFITTDAMNELVRQWRLFKEARPRTVISTRERPPVK